MRTPKTKRGAWRQYNALIRAYNRDFGGGGMFGSDWTTFRLNDPERCAKARELLGLTSTLPD